MKNIYIIGVPRAGKTTLTKLIKQEIPQINLISFEAIRNGFIKSQPELNMENRNSEARKEILPSFIYEFVNWNEEITKYNTLIEGDFAGIESIIKNTSEQDIIICLGFNGRSIEEIIDGIIKNDTETDYTKHWSREQIEAHFYDNVQKDIENIENCKKYNISYYDTYENRQETFLKIVNGIKQELINEVEKL